MCLCPPALQTGTAHAGVSPQLSAAPLQHTAPPNGTWDMGGWALSAWEAPSTPAPSSALTSVSQVFWLPPIPFLHLHLYRHAWQDILYDMFRPVSSISPIFPYRRRQKQDLPVCSQRGKQHHLEVLRPLAPGAPSQARFCSCTPHLLFFKITQCV